MFKKVLTVFLVIALVLSVSVPALAVTYSDLTGHWARAYIEDLAARGYLTGYDDGTMRPDNAITAAETLALLSRFYSPDSGEMAYIDEDYGAYVAATVPSAQAWADEEIEICLASGIIAKSELQSVDLSTPIKKELLSLFLGRALQLDTAAAALSGTPLTFDDADEITAAYAGYVSALVSAGIVDGDENNDFCPQSSVTRAVVATMVSRALDYVQKSDLMLEITDYAGLSRTEGIISSVSGGTLYLTGFDGYTREYAVPTSAAVTVNGVTKVLSSTYAGCYAKVSAKENTAAAVAVTSDATVAWVQGKLANLSISSTNYLYVTDLKTGSQTRYTIPASASVTMDGAPALLSTFKTGCFVTLKTVGGAVSEVHAAAGDTAFTGTLTKIVYGTTVALSISGSNGAVCYFPLDITNLPTILRSNASISIDRLKAGDTVTVNTQGCKITSIEVEGNEETITGTLTSTTTTASGTVWVISTADGTVMTLDVDENAGVYSGSAAILLTDVKIGDTVSVVVYGTTITDINLESTSAAASNVTGTVLTTNTSTKVITILTASNKLVYVNAASVSYIISTSTGRSIALSSVTAGSIITAYGEYSSSTSFKAVSIIIGI